MKPTNELRILKKQIEVPCIHGIPGAVDIELKQVLQQKFLDESVAFDEEKQEHCKITTEVWKDVEIVDEATK